MNYYLKDQLSVTVNDIDSTYIIVFLFSIIE